MKLRIIVCSLMLFVASTGWAEFTESDRAELIHIVNTKLTSEAFDPDRDINKLYNYSFPNSKYRAPLLVHAVRLEMDRLVELLLKHPKIDPNLTDSHSSTPLIEATALLEISMFRRIIAHPKTNINLVDDNGYSAMNMALGCSGMSQDEIANRKEMREAIFAKGNLDLGYEDRENLSYLGIAVERSCYDFIEVLSKEPNFDMFSSDNLKAQYRGIDRILSSSDFALKYYNLVEKMIRHPKFYFIEKDKDSLLSIIEIAGFGHALLFETAMSKYRGKIKDLLVNSIDQLPSEWMLVPRAVRGGSVDILKLLIANGVDLTKTDAGEGILFELASPLMNHERALEVLRYLVEIYKFDLNQKNKNGQSLLNKLFNYSYMQDNVALVQYLIALPTVDLNAIDSLGRNLLHLGVTYGAPLSLMESILQSTRFTVKNSVDDNGRTALDFVNEYKKDFDNFQELSALLKKYGVIAKK